MGLSPPGRRAIDEITAKLEPFCAVAVWSSPALRCVLVAEALATRFRVGSIVDPRLQELDFGAWEGRDWNDVPREALDQWAASPRDFAPPGGESGAALIARVRDFHSALRAQAGPLIVVSHGGPLKLLAALLQGAEPDLLVPPPALGSVTIIGPPSS